MTSRRAEKLTDEELLRRHLDGDREAFTILVARHERRVYAVCLRMLGNVEDAQDATQDAFLAALRRAATFQGGAAFSTWLYRVAVNASIDLGRRRSRQPTVTLEPEDPRAGAAPDPGEAVAASVTVEAALAKLPDDARAVIVLCDLCRLPYEEVAEILRVAVGTVKSRVFRARTAMARDLGGSATTVRPSRGTRATVPASEQPMATPRTPESSP